jgi:heme-degrading monooxygenase HmoA
MKSEARNMFTYFWEFIVHDETRRDFERIYGPAGEWVRLFQRSPAYLGTELCRDVTNPGRYVTVDRWKSRGDFDAFKNRWRGEFEVLDQRCTALTSAERLIAETESV